MSDRRACRAYRLRAADPRRTWFAIASYVGYASASGAYSGALAWARATRQPWPLGRVRSAAPKCGRAYRLRELGASWAEVAAELGGTEGAASSAAQYYATTRSLPWPIRAPMSPLRARQVEAPIPLGDAGEGPVEGASRDSGRPSAVGGEG